MKSAVQKSSFKSKIITYSLAGVGIAVGSYNLNLKKTTFETPTEEIVFLDNSFTKKNVISEFDPNELNSEQWQKLGFSERQAATILKFKGVVGGEFTSKEQFKKCYAVSDEMYQELEKYILLPEKEISKAYEQRNFSKSDGFSLKRKGISVSQKFNPDDYTQNDWENLGFSEKQAEAILKYKNYLGGSFGTKEKLKECFVISDENYAKLSPYIQLPENKSNENKRNYEKTKKVHQTFDPNSLDAEGWRNLGFSIKQSETIMNYRTRNLKGSFKNLEDLKACFVISDEKFEEIRPFIRLNPETIYQTNIQNSTKSTPAEAKTDFSKIDINQITYRQLIEFGFDEKNAGMLLGFRKKLGGFVNASQILETYDIDKEIVQKLLHTAKLNTSDIKKYTLAEAPEEWLKNHPYFKYSADKIIYYRILNPDEKKIWKFIKVKPEYEAKMRLYLK